MRRRPAPWIAAGIALTALLSTATPGAAQTGGPVASGEFTGTIAIDGGFSADVADFVPDGTGALVVLVNGSGPLELTLDEGQMSGTWSIAGTQQTQGNFGMGAQGGVATLEGQGTFNGTGEMSGPPSAYALSGAVSTTNTVTFEVVGLMEQSATSSDTTPIQQSLTDVVVLCQQIYGRWDLELRQQIEDIGFNEFIRGYFTASTGVDATEQAEQIGQFVDEVASWANGVGEVTAAERSLFIGRALAILDGVQRFQAELAAPSPCPPDPTFGTELTLAAQDVLARLVAAIPGITNPAVVSLALGSGAIGAGSPVPDGAAALRAQLEADVTAKWNDQLANYPSSTTDADLVDTARTAQMLGMEQLGAIAPSDVILVITGESS
jgi:hypothetical protein